jgi:FtsZ-binding cell division protein ZapB
MDKKMVVLFPEKNVAYDVEVDGDDVSKLKQKLDASHMAINHLLKRSAEMATEHNILKTMFSNAYDKQHKTINKFVMMDNLFKRENNQLKRENDQLKRENDQLKRENDQLKDKMREFDNIILIVDDINIDSKFI